MSAKKESFSRRKIVLALIVLARIFIVTIDARSFENDRLEGEETDGFMKGDSAPIPFNLEEIYRGEFYSKSFNGTWISSNEIIYERSFNGDIVKYNVDSREITVLLEGKILNEYDSSYSYTLSPDHSHMLIGHHPQSKFRHSTFRKYDVYDLRTRTAETIADGRDLLLAKWSTVGNSMIYENGNDLYYRQVDESGSVVIRRLTNDGAVGAIYNGVLDWVYEEEVMGTGRAVWFSPDGNYVAFASINDTEVHSASYFWYGDPGDLTYQYPREIKIKYPKAGTKNPQITLKLVDLRDSDSKLVTLKSPIDAVGTDHILYRVSWMTNTSVAAIWTNRVQNVAQIVSYDINGKMNNLLNMSEKNGWLEIPEEIFSHNEKFFFTKLQETNTIDGRYLHVTSYDLVNEILTNERDLSPSVSAVHTLVTIDRKNGKIYYLAAAPGEPSQRNLYSLDTDGSAKPTCISCSLLTPEGNNCTYASALFSKDAANYALTCSGPDPMTVEIYDSEHKKIYIWEQNEILRKKLKKRLQVTLKTVIIQVNGYSSRARMILPPGFNECHTYPMIVQVYAGPNTAAIKDASSYSFNYYYATNRSVIWTIIDGRGSAYKGSSMLFQIYRRLGTVEIEDQIAVTKKLQETYAWIDSTRTGIWGWSYGGFATAMALATDKENIFKCGISVAPVSSWIYYDSIYTERYMGLPTPEDNLAGYNRSDVTRLVNGMRGKKFMLIHGTGDDNVHYQQSMALARSLEIADIQFEQISYPDEAHALRGVTPHLAHTLNHFWGECLDLSYSRELFCKLHSGVVVQPSTAISRITENTLDQWDPTHFSIILKCQEFGRRFLDEIKVTEFEVTVYI